MIPRFSSGNAEYQALCDAPLRYTYSSVGTHRDTASLQAAIARREKTLTPADRIYATLTLHGRKLLEVTLTGVRNFSALLTMLRARVPRERGLCRLTVRNMTRGWRTERPLRLYPEPVASLTSLYS